MATETRFLMRSPHPGTVSKGSVMVGSGAVLMDFTNDVWDLVADGTPVDGTSGTGATWAGPASTYRDVTGKKLYINTGTKASPTWTVVGSQS